jgi:hypothetical protein
VAGALTLALGVAACGDDEGAGGDGGKGGSSGEAPTLQQFADDANQACADAGTAAKKLGEPKGLEETEKYATDLEDVLDENVAELKELELPEGADGDKAKRFVDAYEKDIEQIYLPALRKVGEAAQSGDRKGTVAAAKEFVAVKTEESDRLAQDIGAPACSE